jgi:hypothetical protein
MAAPSDWHEEERDRDRYFYFDPKLGDQRMNFMPFSLARPITLAASLEPVTKSVRARMYLHVYPCGIGVLQISQFIVFPKPVQVSALRQILSVVGPQNANGIQWTSRLGKPATLAEVVDRLCGLVARSIDGTQAIPDERRGQWHTTLRLDTACDDKALEEALLDPGETFQRLNVSHVKHQESSVGDLIAALGPAQPHDAGGAQPDAPRPTTALAALFFQREFVVATMSPGARRDHAVKAFWRIMTLIEFTLLQHAVYAR